MPNLWVVRPADANETVAAWNIALNRHDGPVAIVLTRQDLPTYEPVDGGVQHGGYIRREGSDVTLLATGSEVHTAMDSAALLEKDGISARVVSLPCWELFAMQDGGYRDRVLGTAPRVSIEAASTFGWSNLVGEDGLSIGIDHFGASAADTVLAEKFGLTPGAVAARVKDHLSV
jgi:transketolase